MGIFSSKSQFNYAFHIISAFFTRITCNIGLHTKKKHYVCDKHLCKLYSCKLCQTNAMPMRYSYRCPECKKCFCVIHYIDHCLLFQYCKANGMKANCTSRTIKINEQCHKLIPTQRFYQIAVNLAGLKIQIEMASNINHKENIIVLFMRASNLHELSI